MTSSDLRPVVLLETRIRQRPLPRRRDRFARLRAVDAGRSARAGRPRQLLHLLLQQLAPLAPYVRAWSEKYKDSGSLVVGVDAPEFTFARDVDAVAEVLKERHLDYPVAIGNDFAIWSALSNRYWPAVYIADADEVIRHRRQCAVTRGTILRVRSA